MSRMSVSIGVFPTRRTKKSCSITEGDTVLRDGSLRRIMPKRVGWLGYWLRQYSSRAHWDFSCSCSIIPASVRPGASVKRDYYYHRVVIARKLKRKFLPVVNRTIAFMQLYSAEST